MHTPRTIDVVFLPGDLMEGSLRGRTVVVFDVLRATTTISAALNAGVRGIRICPDVESARRAAQEARGDRLLCGEVNCLLPIGFDLGNSPLDFTDHAHGGRDMVLSTTNGARAIVSAISADAIFTGALVNASAAASAAASRGLPITLLCAGTGGAIAMEDLIGAGAVLASLQPLGDWQPVGDGAAIAARLFAGARTDLRAALAQSQGGRNVIAAGLEADIDFAAQLDSVPVVGQVTPGSDLIVAEWPG